eukprot:scaffold84678_cov64-Phaeocystis_antarctica.AAC.5
MGMAAPVPVDGIVHTSTLRTPLGGVAPLTRVASGGGGAAGAPARRYAKHKDGSEMWGRKRGVGQRGAGGGGFPTGGFAALRRLVRNAPAAATGAVPVADEEDEERRRRRRDEGLSNIWSVSEH